MNIIVIANFPSNLDGGALGRFTYLAEMLMSQGHKVEVIVSSFMHGIKTQRTGISGNFLSKINVLFEPGYNKNVSFCRFYSHYIWGKNVSKYLKTLDYVPDVVYCAIPSMTAAVRTAKYCHKNNVKFVVDIQDLWPEAFKMVIGNKLLHTFLKPFEWYINRAYSAADLIVAVSETYVKRGLSVNNKINKGLCVFLGNNRTIFDAGRDKFKINRKDDEFWIGYVGSMGDSYDIGCIIDAISIAQNHNCIPKIRFVLCGNGEKRFLFEQQAKDNNVEADFIGSKPYDEMAGILCSCDVVVNPIVKGSAASVINKVGDYALSGLPVINTQESPEYRDLVDAYECGINCDCGNAQQVANAIVKLISDKELRNKMGDNARKLGIEKFDRRNTYQQIIDYILN